MRSVLVLLGLIFLPLSSTASTIDLSWNRCQPIVPVIATAGPDRHVVFVSVTGQVETQQGFEFWILVRSSTPEQGYPDAWRFDAEGCQGLGRVSIEHQFPLGVKTCPVFMGANASLQIKHFMPAPDHLGVAPDTYVAVLANVYPAGSATTNPLLRYVLGAVIFDHTTSVEGASPPGTGCGGFETPMCLSLVESRCGWVDMAGEVQRFTPGQSWLAFQGTELACTTGPVPAAASTWGAIKGTYRR